MRTIFWFLVLPALVSAASCGKKTPVPAAETRAEQFERLRRDGEFTPDAYVVWSPLWPTQNGTVTLLYDTRAKNAPLRDVAALDWILRPPERDPMNRAMSVESGIARLEIATTDFVPGRFSFRSGDRVDNNCGNPPALPIVDAKPDWQSRASEHFVYKWLPGDPVAGRIDDVLGRLEKRRAAILAATGLTSVPDKVTFLHYASREQGFSYQAHRGNNADWSRNLVFSAEAEDDAHELTHLFFNRALSRHVGLFDEGVAIHFGQEIAAGQGWRDRPCDAWARNAISEKKLPPLRELVTPEQMYSKPWSTVGDVYYPAGCSFVRHLVSRHGIEKLRAFMAGFDCDSQNDATAMQRAFEKAFGSSLDAVDAEWRAGLPTP